MAAKKKKTPSAAAKSAAPAASQPQAAPVAPVAAPGAAAAPAAAEQAPAAGPRRRRPKLTVDWSVMSWGAFIRKKSRPVAVAPDKAGILAAIAALPVSKQEQCFVAEFKPVQIKSHIEF